MPEHYALIVGSGFEKFSQQDKGSRPQTRFGMPSAAVKTIVIEGHRVMSLARHGEPHSIPPHAINYRANLLALQECGATQVIALNTVGVISAVREPGQIAVPDQILDYTWGREHTIYDGSTGALEHIEFTEPLSNKLRTALLEAARAAGLDCHDGGVYAATQGPRLETAAEVDRLERDGADFVGMTAMPEAAIAQELGLSYACLSLIVNRAAGRSDTPIHADVEASTCSARRQAESLLRQLFKGKAASNR
tara:strand:+ start:4793 stop:5542 length:750 start_codon:yes stop_codon:yes gene_type:complete